MTSGHPLLLCIFLIGTGALFPSALSGQADCTYDECALRIRYRSFIGVDVVRGESSEEVAGYSFFGFAPRLKMLESGSDSITVNYEAFRSGTNSAAVLEIIGMAGILAGYLVAQFDGDVGWSVGLSLGGLVPFTWGTIRHLGARDRLSRAIWWYNRRLR